MRQILNNERGVAILVALFAMIFLLVIATEVSYDTNVEYVVAAQKVNRLKAYYAAKSGVELSLFRIMLYKKAYASFGDKIAGNPQGQNIMNQIWQFPFGWPPLMPDDIDPVAKDEIATALEESFMDAQYTTTITGEGGKIDINDLGSVSEEIANATRASVLAIFETELENNEDFEEKYSNEKFEELVNNIADWVDEDQEGRNSRGEQDSYEQPDDADPLPPNRAFRTIAELHMVAGMNDDFFRLLQDRVTVYGTKGVNPNSATELVLKSLDAQIDDEAAGKIIERRSNLEKGGPFKDDDDFFSFLNSIGVNTGGLEDLEIPFYYDAEYNFRIVSVGKFANVVREITAISFDVENLSERYAEFLKNVNQDPNATPTPTPTPGGSGGSSATKFKEVKGRPIVVYWEEN